MSPFATIVILAVAGQLIASLIADGLRHGQGGLRIEPALLPGTLLVVVGAVLIVRGRGQA